MSLDLIRELIDSEVECILTATCPSPSYLHQFTLHRIHQKTPKQAFLQGLQGLRSHTNRSRATNMSPLGLLSPIPSRLLLPLPLVSRKALDVLGPLSKVIPMILRVHSG